MSRTWASHLQCNVLEMCWFLSKWWQEKQIRLGTWRICCSICYFNACLVLCLYGLMRTSVPTAVPRPDDTHWAAVRAKLSCVSACDSLWLYTHGSRRRARFNTFPGDTWHRPPAGPSTIKTRALIVILHHWWLNVTQTWLAWVWFSSRIIATRADPLEALTPHRSDQ